MLGKRLIKTSAGAACTTDTVQILDGVPFQSIATYELDGDATNLVETGYINKAGVFNGSSSRINLPSNPINGLSSVSFSFWIKPNDIASYQYVLSFINSVDGWNGLGIRITNTGKIQVVRANSGAVTTTENSTTTLSLNVWQHVAVSVQQSGAVIYINGSPDGTFSSTPFTTNNTGSFDIGMNEYASGVTQAFTNGSIDQVRIFNRVITANEVTTLYGETSASSTKSTTDIFADSSALALYEFEGNANDTGGTYNGTATNVVYNEYDGTASNVTYSTGKFGQAAVFTGSSASTGSRISFSNNAYGSSTTVFSASLWVKCTNTAGEIPLIGNGSTVGGTTGYVVYINSGSLTLSFANGSSYDFFYGQSINDNNWHHIAITYNNGAYVLYLDGSVELSGTSSIFLNNATPTYDTFLGNRWARTQDTTNAVLNGSIDQVRIYDKAISAADVTTLYNETAATASTNPTFNSPSLVAYYKMNDATDETGSYDGTPTNVNFNVAGKFGNAGDFNGSSSKIILPNSLSTAVGNNDFSVSFFVYVNDVSNDEVYVNLSNPYQFYVRKFASGNIYIELGGVNGFDTGVSLSTGWHHIAVTKSSTAGLVLYIDNTANTFSSKTANLGSASVDTSLGGYNNGTLPLDGKLDQVRIFDRAITANEVEKLYNEVYCQPTIVPTDHFEPVIYTGNGSSQSISTLDFQPDLVWIKGRSVATSNNIFDSIRGNKRIIPNTTNAEVDLNPYAPYGLTSFNSNGFTVGDNYNGDYGLNGDPSGTYGSSQGYVAWNWKAGGAAVSNTDGTITSTVSANQDAGFSIVKWTSTGSNTSSETVGHGLENTPDVIILKNLSAAGTNWRVYHSGIPSPNNALALNTTEIAFPFFPSVSSNTFGLANSTTTGEAAGTSGQNIIAYCFHSVDGMSKIGSYTATGSAGTPIVQTGFKPAFVMVKNINKNQEWIIIDNKRNDGKNSLQPNSSAAENTVGDNAITLYTNGFAIAVSGSGVNYQSGDTFIFMAIAEENVEPQPVLANSFNTVLYTGNGGTQAINTVGFQPDFVWTKQRNTTQNHRLFDSVRGATNILMSNNTNPEATNTQTLTSFDSNGFTLGNNVAVNGSSGTYVAWCWKASNESTINNDGSITSIVSANPAAGFSIVKYDGAAISGAATTVGHGLDSAPELMIIKIYETGLTASSWFVYSENVGNTKEAYLNSTAAFVVDTNRWNSTSPSSTVFTLGSSFSSYPSYYGGDTIAYCFHSVDGYQKVGSYTGTGASGNSVTTGFRPKFVMVKKTSGTANWVIKDSQRDSTNPNSANLYPNLSNAENTVTTLDMDLDNNGFTLDGTSGDVNGSGQTYIYLAIK